MVIYLGRQRPGKMHRDYPEPHSREKRHYYTCKNFQDNGPGMASGCGIYADRPQVCRSFPNGIRCPYADCEWSAVNGPEPQPEKAYNTNGLRLGHPALALAEQHKNGTT